MALAVGKPVLRLFDANGTLCVTMDAARIERITISRAGQVQVITSPAADYELAIFDTGGRADWPTGSNPPRLFTLEILPTGVCAYEQVRG